MTHVLKNFAKFLSKDSKRVKRAKLSHLKAKIKHSKEKNPKNVTKAHHHVYHKPSSK